MLNPSIHTNFAQLSKKSDALQAPFRPSSLIDGLAIKQRRAPIRHTVRSATGTAGKKARQLEGVFFITT